MSLHVFLIPWFLLLACVYLCVCLERRKFKYALIVLCVGFAVNYCFKVFTLSFPSGFRDVKGTFVDISGVHLSSNN